MHTKLKKINEGFTIVETLIVLAIAALIITIVLIAVPDLQRSARNSGILHDAQNIAAAVQTYESNNQGSIPNEKPTSEHGPTITIGATATATATAQVQGSDVVNITNFVPASVTWASSSSSSSSSSTSTSTSINVGTIIVVEGANCNGSNPGPATGQSLTPTANSRGVAVYYPIENSSGGNVGCIQV